MNFYSFHIGDYLSATAHLSILEHGAYRRLLDVYYVAEFQLPGDVRQVYRLIGARAKEEKEAVDVILEEFFEKTEIGYRHGRCEHEISVCNKNRTNGKRGGRPPKSSNPDETQTESQRITETKPKGNPDETQTESPPSPHHPITNSPHNPPKGGKPAIEFKTFLANCKAVNEKPISDYRPVLDYAETVGLPVEMIELCWNEFFRRHAPGGVSESKRYKDWRQAFRKCVEGNWFKLWWHNQETNSFELTTSGRMAEKVAA